MNDAKGFEHIQAAALEKMQAEKSLDDYMLVDVRQPEEYRAGHIPGATLLPLSELEGKLDTLPSEGKDLVFYCAAGKRSDMAARLAADNGRFAGKLLSLEGGFGGWQGMALPEFPNIAAFSAADSLQDMLLRAMEQEKGAMRLYQGILDAATGRIICSLMEELASFEKAHARAVYAHLKRAWQGPEPIDDFETLFGNMSGEILEGGRDLAELEPWIEDAKSGSCMNLAELALELEMSALDIYETLAGRMEEQQARDVFHSLAKQEMAHARMIMKHLDDFMAPLDEPGQVGSGQES